MACHRQVSVAVAAGAVRHGADAAAVSARCRVARVGRRRPGGTARADHAVLFFRAPSRPASEASAGVVRPASSVVTSRFDLIHPRKIHLRPVFDVDTERRTPARGVLLRAGGLRGREGSLLAGPDSHRELCSAAIRLMCDGDAVLGRHAGAVELRKVKLRARARHGSLTGAPLAACAGATRAARSVACVRAAAAGSAPAGRVTTRPARAPRTRAGSSALRRVRRRLNHPY